MKALTVVLIAVGCLAPNLSFATDCLAGFPEDAKFGELVALELDFGARLVPNNSKCTEGFQVNYSNLLDAYCEVCGQVPAVGDQVIGKRRVVSKGIVTVEPRYPQFNNTPTYTYDIHLQEISPGNPLVLRCYGAKIRGYDYNITNERTASTVIAALAMASVRCAKPKVRVSCF